MAAAREALKGPNAELEKAKRNFEASTQDVSRWQAELVNVERHVELNNLRELESELGELKDLLTEAEGFRNSAMQAVQAASESLRLMPEKIAQAEKLVQDKQGKVKSLKPTRAQSSKPRRRKRPLSRTRSVGACGQERSRSQARQFRPCSGECQVRRNHRPSEAGSFQYGKSNCIQTAGTSGSGKRRECGKERGRNRNETARKRLKVLAEKELALAEAKKKHEENKVAFDSLKKKVDQQSALTQTLLKSTWTPCRNKWP